MHATRIRALAVALLILRGLGAAAADGGSQADAALMQRALATAQVWAQDQSLILYCLRRDSHRAQWAQAVAGDRDKALAALRNTGATQQQADQVAAVIAQNYRVAEPSAEDPALNEACRTRDVERNIQILGPIAWPLWMRPPFNRLK